MNEYSTPNVISTINVVVSSDMPENFDDSHYIFADSLYQINRQFPYRLIFVLDKFRQQKPNSRKEPFKSSKLPKFGRKML